MKRKTLIPNDFRDFLSFISFVGFLGIFLSFTFNLTWVSDNITGLFLILGGSSFLVLGKALTFNKWIRDGIQENEPIKILTLVIGLSSLIIGILFLAQISIPVRFLGYVGIVAIIPAIYTIIDYYKKNVKRRY